jgi:hypothetical protein
VGDPGQNGIDLGFLDQGHAALGKLQGIQKPFIIDPDQNVNQGIAQAQYFFHVIPCTQAGVRF